VSSSPLTPNQASVLATLNTQDEITAQRLAFLTDIPLNSVRKALSVLRREGLAFPTREMQSPYQSWRPKAKANCCPTCGREL